jgi:hypothetical protein
VRAIGGQYEYSNSAEYQIGRPRNFMRRGGRGRRRRRAVKLRPRRRLHTSRNATNSVQMKVSNRPRLLPNRSALRTPRSMMRSERRRHCLTESLPFPGPLFRQPRN